MIIRVGLPPFHHPRNAALRFYLPPRKNRYGRSCGSDKTHPTRVDRRVDKDRVPVFPHQLHRANPHTRRIAPWPVTLHRRGMVWAEPPQREDGRPPTHVVLVAGDYHEVHLQVFALEDLGFHLLDAPRDDRECGKAFLARLGVDNVAPDDKVAAPDVHGDVLHRQHEVRSGAMKEVTRTGGIGSYG
jgi:hypothetical protein